MFEEAQGLFGHWVRAGVGARARVRERGLARGWYLMRQRGSFGQRGESSVEG